MVCEQFESEWGISWQHKMTVVPNVDTKLFDVWVLDFTGHLVRLYKNCYILVAVDYVSKFVEDITLLNDKAKSVTQFLKRCILTDLVPLMLS